jgi:hypothetical protein
MAHKVEGAAHCANSEQPRIDEQDETRSASKVALTADPFNPKTPSALAGLRRHSDRRESCRLPSPNWDEGKSSTPTIGPLGSVGGAAEGDVGRLRDPQTKGGVAMVNDIFDVFDECEPLPVKIWGELGRWHGVDVDTLTHRWERLPLLAPRYAAVVFLDNGGFEFAAYRPEDSRIEALIFPVLDELADGIDLCAWAPSRQPALWRSMGCMLGAERLFGARMQEALPVHRTVLNWLRANCRGVVILDGPKSADLLRRVPSLLAEDEGHREELGRLLEVIPPQICVVPEELGRSA